MLLGWTSIFRALCSKGSSTGMGASEATLRAKEIEMNLARQLTVCGLVFFVALFAGTAIATPVEWPIASGGNGHLYEAVYSGGSTWEDAQIAAEAAGGYLATITSAEENAFVFSLVHGKPEYWNGTSGPWLGGFQPPGSPEPAGNWIWITGEPFGYTNWYPGEPTNGENQWGGEDGLIFLEHTPMWADVGRLDYFSFVSYVVEIPEPGTVLLLATGCVFALRRRKTR